MPTGTLALLELNGFDLSDAIDAFHFPAGYGRVTFADLFSIELVNFGLDGADAMAVFVSDNSFSSELTSAFKCAVALATSSSTFFFT